MCHLNKVHLKSLFIIKTAALALYAQDGKCHVKNSNDIKQKDPYLDLDWP